MQLSATRVKLAAFKLQQDPRNASRVQLGTTRACETLQLVLNVSKGITPTRGNRALALNALQAHGVPMRRRAQQFAAVDLSKILLAKLTV